MPPKRRSSTTLRHQRRPKKARIVVDPGSGYNNTLNEKELVDEECVVPQSGLDSKTISGEVDRHLQTLIDTSQITLRNAQESPLLRLPSELRNVIWELAFGWRTIHPYGEDEHDAWERVPPRLKRWTISYGTCAEDKSDQEVYEMSLEGPSETSPVTWKAEGMVHGRRLVGLHHSESKKTLPTLVPTVCKQICTEAVPLAWKTSTFAFTNSGDLQHFVNAPSVRLDLIRQLSLISSFAYWPGSRYDLSWSRALKSHVWDKFTSLRGLHLILRRYVWPETPSGSLESKSLDFDIMGSCANKVPALVTLIRRFQKHPLEPQHTTVLVTNDCSNARDVYPRFNIADRLALAAVIRTLLLQRKMNPKAGRHPPSSSPRRSERLKPGRDKAK